ncbi:hypothetical protein SAMN05421678_103330 [Actinopolymorpha cephalotaxi]|uniref:Uncharacterized protein n=1 Tax=Actinopolymorpha cephalotaxi TaxID=504797 RepID=A0A1I2NDX4_9ACTN|nr:hypothetical protein [Actinopolymorpha cephalotaxi]NYH85562.1 hypothetical protein [Actinopolymorpha cephalotaxi]SFG02125.1 hypothetical protein SAMN05421678_103330 [Actinopolymorpha cephalotaxi]
MTRERSFAGIKVSPVRRADLLAELDLGDRTDGTRPLTVTYLNPDYARRALRSPRLRDDINAFDVVLVDGNGVRLLTPLFGFTVPERLDTDSLAPDVFGRLARRGIAATTLRVPPTLTASARTGSRSQSGNPTSAARCTTASCSGTSRATWSALVTSPRTTRAPNLCRPIA